MKIAITVGHSKLKNGTFTSAKGIKLEYAYCKEQGQALKEVLEKEGHLVTLIVCPEGRFSKASEEKGYKLGLINGKRFDLVIELHLNAFNGTAKGSEVLYLSSKGKEYADRVAKRLGDKFSNRGSKLRNDLYILRDTDCPAILIESFFCDSVEDCRIADSIGVKAITKLIAEGVLNRTIVEAKPQTFKNGNYENRKAKVTASSLNVRWDRGTKYDIVGSLKKGDIVNLKYCIEGWISIEGFKGNKGLGYVNVDYLELI